jgi:hypothetical protein
MNNNPDLDNRLIKPVCIDGYKNKSPLNAVLVSSKDLIDGRPSLYCYDSRKDRCPYCITYDNRDYCNYKVLI